MNEVLRQLREEKGWTQTRLAKESGVSQTYISELEAGKSAPTVPIVRKLASALCVPVTVLFDNANQPSIHDTTARPRKVVESA